MKNLDVIVNKTKEEGFIAAHFGDNLKPDVNYAVTFIKGRRYKQRYYYGNELTIKP